MNTHGELGQSAEDFEKQRIARLGDSAAVIASPTPAIMRDRTVTVADQQRRMEVTEALKPLVGEAFAGLQRFLEGVQHDIRAQTELMRAMDAPMEAITESHERASESFETLRGDLASIGLETPKALRELKDVMDTAGLNEAQSRAEKRFENLATLINDRLTGLVKAQEIAFKGIALDMTKVLHLLERLQARELRDLKKRARSRR